MGVGGEKRKANAFTADFENTRINPGNLSFYYNINS